MLTCNQCLLCSAGRRRDKVAILTMLAAVNTAFHVAADLFLVHLPHAPAVPLEALVQGPVAMVQLQAAPFLLTHTMVQRVALLGVGSNITMSQAWKRVNQMIPRIGMVPVLAPGPSAQEMKGSALQHAYATLETDANASGEEAAPWAGPMSGRHVGSLVQKQLLVHFCRLNWSASLWRLGIVFVVVAGASGAAMYLQMRA